MIKIPFPIPEPERTRLIAAGQAACAVKFGTETNECGAREAASKKVRAILSEITLRYGFEE